MAKPKVEIQIPKDLGLTRTQVSELQKSFQKQLVETLKGKARRCLESEIQADGC